MPAASQDFSRRLRSQCAARATSLQEFRVPQCRTDNATIGWGQKANRVMQAMLKMKKIEIEPLQRAYQGG